MSKNTHKTIAIIGSGIGGLASAALLAKDGYKVDVYEKNEQLGGRASLYKEKGFTFDMGPSWFMMPDVFEKYYAEFGLKLSDVLKLTPLDPQYRVYFENKEFYDMSENIGKTKQIFENLEKGAAKKFDEYLADSKIKYEIALNSILYKNADNPLDLFSKDLINKSFGVQNFLPIKNHIAKYFKNPKIQQILTYNIVFLGCSPDNAPALFSMMAHADFGLGVFYPKGGIYEIVRSLVKLGKKYNVTYHYNSPVTEIITHEGLVTHIKTNGKKVAYDIVISNADYKFTESLIDNENYRTYSDKYWDKKILTPSAFLLYLGVKGKLPQLIHHTLYFGSDWKAHFREIFDTPTWPTNPSFYINKTSATDDKVAPKGHENLMVLVPIAAGLEENKMWKESYSNYIVNFIDDKIGTNIAKNIVYKKIFSVSDFTSRYNSTGGNALGGLAHTLFQSSIFRPTNKSKKLNNLFFAGANTVPGIGVPPAIVSSHLVRDRIKKYDTQKD
ncbi:phytoene desaturase [Candidatus Woesebacteria bacterium]|nr:MAG: phytoene desaturase [Candidatus Woesebacteria bacterium]